MKTGWQKTLSRLCIPQRYLLSLMGFFAVANAYTMRVCLNVAITVMVKKNVTGSVEDPLSCPADDQDGGTANEGEFDWSQETQGLILSSFFWGYVITHIPGGMLAERFGGKYVLSLGILSTAFFTLLTPVVTRAGGSTALIILRVLEGLGEGPTFPALNTLLANWAPPQEKSRLGSFAFAGSLIGTVVGQALSGAILASNDWSVVFYVFGGITIVWFIIFTLVCYSNPHQHPFISDKELKFLDENLIGLDQGTTPPIPWKAMAVSIPLWGLLAAQVGHDWVFFTMVTDLPKYMADVLKFDIKSNGFLSALPYLVMWITSILFAYLCDFIIKKKWWTVTFSRKFFTTVASVGPAAGIIAASYAGCNRAAVVALFTVAMGLMGAFYPGMKVNALDLSPNFAGILMAIVNGTGAFSGIITPYLVGALTPDSTLLQWRLVFWISVGVAILTNVIFVLCGSGELQPWNKIPQKEGVEEFAKNVDDDNNTIQPWSTLTRKEGVEEMSEKLTRKEGVEEMTEKLTQKEGVEEMTEKLTQKEGVEEMTEKFTQKEGVEEITEKEGGHSTD